MIIASTIIPLIPSHWTKENTCEFFFTHTILISVVALRRYDKKGRKVFAKKHIAQLKKESSLSRLGEGEEIDISLAGAFTQNLSRPDTIGVNNPMVSGNLR